LFRFALQSINSLYGCTHSSWRSLPFLQNQAILFEELVGLQSLAHQSGPVAQLHRSLNVARDDPNRGVAPLTSGLDVFPASIFPHLVSVALRLHSIENNISTTNKQAMLVMFDKSISIQNRERKRPVGIITVDP
jgi:hypothetical protein